jgi:hypothetical protein
MADNSYTLGQEVELYLDIPVTNDQGATVDCDSTTWYVIPPGGIEATVTAQHMGSAGSGAYQGFYTPTMAGWHHYKFIGINPDVAALGRFYVRPDRFA